MLLPTKRGLWLKAIIKDKELTMTRLPIAMLKSIRILLAITAHYDYEILKMDVKTFLNGNLTEDLCMTQPEGFTSKDCSKVCKLQKSIYGLKKASRSWNIQFDKIIKEFHFSKKTEEVCV